MKFTSTLLPLLIVICNLLNAQHEAGFCGTESTAKMRQLLDAHRAEINAYERKPERMSTDFPVTIHIIRKEDGTGGFEVDALFSLIDEANVLLSPANISLSVCDTVRYIDSDQFYDFYKPDESSLFYPTYEPNTLNLYISNSITYSSGQTRCGYAYFPGWKDMVMVDQNCMTDGSTFIHEIGHYFGLYHTHGNSNSTTDELNDLSNCYIAGDDVCDTPADPFLAYTVDTATCAYIGSGTDENGEPYNPDPSNLMSYAPKVCKAQFSEGQYDRMSYVAKYLRDYLACPQLTAAFDISSPVDVCGSGQPVILSYIGTGANTLIWDIGADGSPDGTGTTLEFQPLVEGAFEVCLTAEGGQDTLRSCRQLHNIPVSTVPLGLDFDIEHAGAVINPDMQHGWDEVYLSENSGGVLIMDNFHYNEQGAEDIYYLATVDLTDQTTPHLSLDIAYAPYSPSRIDGLRIQVSTDCGLNYEDVYFAEGLDLSSTGEYAYGQWMPSSAADWKTEVIDLSAYYNDTITLRLLNINGHGNYLYIDQVQILGSDPLPLQFIAFDAISDPHGNHLLSWVTADETNLKKYYVERSIDGQSFVPLASMSPEHGFQNVYHYTVYNPLEVSYYRIRSDQEDGQQHYSPIIEMRSTEQSERMFPNPVAETLYIDASLPDYIEVSVIDLSGRVLKLNTTRQGDVLAVDVASLPRGLYTVIAGNFHGRFVKAD